MIYDEEQYKIEEALINIRKKLLFRCDTNGNLIGINEAGNIENRDAPFVYVCWSSNKIAFGYRLGLDHNIKNSIDNVLKTRNSFPLNEDYSISKEVLKIINVKYRAQIIHEGPTYRFPQLKQGKKDIIQITRNNIDLLEQEDIETKEQIDEIQPFLAKIIDKRIISTCQTVRKEGIYVEAGVDTKEGFRQKGYGKEVTYSWAMKALEMGLFPLYSTSWNNFASISLAKSIGLIQFGVEFSIMKVD